MHQVRLLLLSVLLAAGCAADDSVDTIADVSRATPASSIDQAAPTLAASPDGTISTGTPGTTAAPAGSTAPATVTDSADTPIETATAPAGTTSETTTTTPTPTTTPTGTTSETTTTTPTPTTTPTGTTSETTTTTPTGATSMPEEPGVDGFAVFVDATCDVCHRADGEGADLSASMLHIDAVIEVIRFGVPDTQMEGWDFEPKPPGLTRAEIEAVATYVMSLRNG